MTVQVLRPLIKARPMPTVAAVLRDVNKVRRQEGRAPLKRLPKGVPVVMRWCPIGKALHREILFGPTELIDNFIHHFDRGEYPDLVSRPAKRKKKQFARPETHRTTKGK